MFGDGFLIQNQMRADLVRAREVAKFLLNDVALKILDFFEKLDKHALSKNPMNPNQQVRLGNQQHNHQNQPQLSLYYEKTSNNDATSLAPSLVDQQQAYQSQARKARANKVKSSENIGYDQMPQSASQHRENIKQSGPILGFVNQLNQKKGKNMEADLNFNLFNDYEGEESPQKEANATLDEPRAAHSATKHLGHYQSSPRDNVAMTNRSNRSMNTMKSGERKSINTRRSSQMGLRSGGNLANQAVLAKRIGQQNKFLDEIKSQMQAMYDEHDDFNDFILTDQARESLLRHMSVAARKPEELRGDYSVLMADRRLRSPEEDSSMLHNASINNISNIGKKP